MKPPKMVPAEHDPESIRYTRWRGSSYSDDVPIILRNMTRSYMDPKGLTRNFLGFRLAREERQQP